MKQMTVIPFLILAVSASLQAQSVEEEIARAVMAAPPALTAEAGVVRLADDGSHEVLREAQMDLSATTGPTNLVETSAPNAPTSETSCAPDRTTKSECPLQMLRKPMRCSPLKKMMGVENHLNLAVSGTP